MAPAKKKISKKKAPAKKKVAKKPAKKKSPRPVSSVKDPSKAPPKKDTRFKKEKSGNASGRPRRKMDPCLKSKCKDMTEQVLNRLKEILEANVEPKVARHGAQMAVVKAAVRVSDQVKACEIILAYGHGKPTQYVATPEDESLKISGADDLLAALSSMAE